MWQIILSGMRVASNAVVAQTNSVYVNYYNLMCSNTVCNIPFQIHYCKLMFLSCGLGSDKALLASLWRHILFHLVKLARMLYPCIRQSLNNIKYCSPWSSKPWFPIWWAYEDGTFWKISDRQSISLIYQQPFDRKVKNNIWTWPSCAWSEVALWTRHHVLV